MQLKIGLDTGDTLSFELPQGIEAWQAKQSDSGFQAKIRGLSLLHGGKHYALPMPASFRKVIFTAEVKWNGHEEPSSAKIGYIADDVTAAITLYFREQPPMARFDLRRTGKPRWLAPSTVNRDRQG